MFESFFEWSDEQGLPFRSWADALQEKGIPPAALLVVPLLLIAGVAFFFLNQGPATGTLVITATTFSGEPLADVSVKLLGSGDFKASSSTDSNGRSSFEKVPAGKINVNVNSPIVVFSEPNFDVPVKAGSTSRKTVAASLQEAQGVNLVVDVQTADAPKLTLLDADGKVLEEVAEQTSYSFSVAKNTEYVVKAEQEGFTPDEQRVQVAESNRYVLLVPSRNGRVTNARLHVRVVEAKVGGGPLANASVQVFQADALLRTARTSEDGSAPALDVPLGGVVRVAVSAEGYSEASQDVNVSSPDQSVSVALSSVAPAFSGVRVTVKDSAGNAVYSPLVRLYSGSKLLDESFPEEGIAIFNVSHSSALAVSAYKSGYLPAYVSPVGKDQLVLLTRSDNQSARVRVHVTDRRGVDAARVSVSILDNQSKPSGLPVRLTGEDGSQVFDDVPLRSIRVVASDGVRSVASGLVLPDEEANETLVALQFPPVSVVVPVSVVDHFTRNPVANAKVSSGNASCSTNAKGTCTFVVLESDDALFRVAADGYSDLDSSALSVFAGMPALAFDLTSSAVAKNVRLRFDGVFDVSGRKVKTLSPLSEYEARYAVVSPGVEFSKAEAEVAIEGASVLGGQGVGARVSKRGATESAALADVPPISISADGFSQPAFEVTQGGSVWFVNPDNATHVLVFDDGQSVSIPEGQNRSVVFNKVGGFAFKSLRNPQLSGFATVLAPASVDVQDASGVLLEYGSFNGSRQFSVRFKTGTGGTVVLQHRSAFFTSIETLRSPADGLSESARMDVAFSGTCTESVCVQWYFSYNGRKSTRLELPWGQGASLIVNVYGLSSDGVLGVSSGTPAITLLSGRSNSSIASVTPFAARIRADEAFSSAEFSFKAVRLAADAPLSINVTDGRSVLFETEAFVSVFSKDAPALVVSVRPNRVEALSTTKLVFSIKDTLEQVVQGARVSVGDQEAVESINASGVYVVDELSPDSLSPIPFEVTKEGYRSFTGSIVVEPPEQAVDLTPPALALSVDSKEPASAPVQLSNKLADKLRASISVSLDAGGQITDVSPSTTSLVLPASGSASFELKAAIKESVFEVARKAGQLKEKVRGTVHVRVSGKGYSETFDVPFSVDSVFSQTALDEAWSLSPDSLQFNLEPPKVKSASVEVTVSNTGPYPMVFNVEQTLGLSVQPASLTLAAGVQDAFVVKAFLPREIDCFSQDLQKKGAMTVYGTFQGLTSKKTASINLDVSTASLACQPPNGYRLTLPIDVRMEFLANARSKTNPDGSTSVLLPTRELLWFGPGASVTPIDAQVPQSTPFMLDRRFVQPLPEGGWTVAFPVGVTLNLPSDADYQPFGASGQMLVTLDDAQIILPPGVQTSQAQGNARLSAAGVSVPPLQPVTFRRIPFNYDALQNLLPPDSVEIKLPTDATFDLLPGTIERKNVQPRTQPRANALNSYSYLPKAQSDASLLNIKAIQLPTGERMAFGDGAAIALEKGLLTLPSGTPLYVSRLRLYAVKDLPIEEAFELRMPLPYALTVLGPSSKSFKTQDGKNALKVTDEAVVEASWSLSVSKQQSLNVLRVARENALTFLKGAYARIPYDPASVAKCSFTYAPPDSVAFTLPTGTAVQKTAKGYEAILPTCDDTARIVFSVSGSSGTAEVFHSPAVKKIVFAADSEFTVGDVSDAEEKSVRTAGPVELTACLKDAAGKDVADALKEAKVSFAENSVVSMPERVLAGFKENQADVDLGVLTPISFGSKSGALTQMGSTKKITLHAGGQKIQAARPPQYSGSGLLMPKGSSLSFLPVCEKGSGRLDVTITADDVFAALDKDGKTGVLEIAFSNKYPDQFNQKKEICLFNNGKQSATLDAVTSTPEQALASEHKPFYQSIVGAFDADAKVSSERAYFSEPAVYGKRQNIAVEPSVEGQPNCRAFTLEFSLPQDLLKLGCIAPGKVPPTMAGYYDFKFHDVNGEPVAETDKHRLPVKMTFDANESDCQAYQEQKQFADLTGISVNYDTQELADTAGGSGEDKLYFKDAGHTRFFAIVNNEEKPIRVKSITGAGAAIMTCKWRDGQSANFIDLAPDKQIGPAELLLLHCTSNPGSAGKSGPYRIDFLGDSFNPTKTINVHVWNPGAARSLYPYTAIGKAIPFFEATGATPKEKAQAGFASFETWAFADPAPALTSQTAAAAAATPPEPEKTEAEKEAERKARAAAVSQASSNLLNFRLCKKFFCTSGQAENALYSFSSTFRELVNQRISQDRQAVELTALDNFCRELEGGRQFQKTILLQLSNTGLSADNTLTQSLQLEQKIKTDYFPDMKHVDVKTSSSGQVLFSGCGLYRVTARLDPACSIRGTSPSEWMSHMSVELRIDKLEDCPVNLANAGLLTAQTPYAYSGNQLGKGALSAIRQALFSRETWSALSALPGTAFASNDPDKMLHVFQNIGRLRQGVLGRYGSEANEQDQQTARHLFSSLYGADLAKNKKIMLCPNALDGFKDKPCPATYYEDQAFCWRTGGPVVGSLGATAAGIVALQTGMAAVTGASTAGAGALYSVKALAQNYRLISTLSGCVAGAGAEWYAGRSAASCRSLDMCTSTLLAGVIEMVPVPYNVGLTATQRLSIAQSTTASAATSAFGSLIVQSALGAGIITATDSLIGGEEPQHYPVVPITIALRQGLSPDRLERGAIGLYRLRVSPLPDTSPTKQVEQIVAALEAQGLYGPQGRRTAGEVARVLQQAAAAHDGDAYANALVRGLSRLDDRAARQIQGQLANPGHALDELAEHVAEHDRDFARQQVLGGLGIGTENAQQRANLRTFFEGLGPDVKRRILYRDELRKEAYPFTIPAHVEDIPEDELDGAGNLVKRTIKRVSHPDETVDYLEAVKAKSKGLSPQPDPAHLWDPNFEHAGIIGEIDKAVKTDGKIFDLDRSNLIRGVQAYQEQLLNERIARLSAAQQAEFIDAINRRMVGPQAATYHVLAGSPPQAVASNIRNALTDNVLSISALQEEAARFRMTPLPRGYAGLRGLMELDLNELPGRNPVERMRNAFNLQQMYARNGQRNPITQEFLENSRSAEAQREARRGVRQALAAEDKANRIIRSGTVFASFVTAFLFNTDFRPVQIQVASDKTNSHVIAVHTENNVATAESVCIQGVAKECKGGGTSGAGVLSVTSLCGPSSVCLKLLQWPSGNQQAYAVVAGFNDGTTPSTTFLASLFEPDKAPVDPQEYVRLKLGQARIDYAPVTNAGFADYQPQAPDPKDDGRQVQIKLAQGIVTKLNAPEVQRAVPNDQRLAVQAMARKAETAFNQKRDAEGVALLNQAQTAFAKLMAGAKFGG